MYYTCVSQQPLTSLRELAVTGHGKVMAKADYVQLHIEVSTQGYEISKAQQENATITSRVIQSLIELDIPREAIQTAAYTISPNYDYVEGRQIFRGYEVTNALTVNVSDISRAGTVIDTAVQNGSNRIASIQFKIENTDIYYQQALSLALQNAQMKARTIAETMQLPLHTLPIEIVEESTNEPILYKSMAMADDTVSTPIEQGQIAISATVRVKFQY
ncbi:MAG: SIMPL domain-containing protein [Lysinibacillus sp.]